MGRAEIQERRLVEDIVSQRPLYARAEDYAECRRLHRAFGASYYFATLRLPGRIRPRVHSLYGFVRIADEWVDNPGSQSSDEVAQRLKGWRDAFCAGMEGTRPEEGVLRAFCDTALATGIPLAEPLAFLDAMAQDLSVSRYPTYSDLRRYMRGSAVAVGIMMCHLLEADIDDDLLTAAGALAEAMQLTNFLRDLGEDAARGRIYLPLDDLERFGVREATILEGRPNEAFRELLGFEIARARALYAIADAGIERLPSYSRKGIRLARALYSGILDRIEDCDYDVFSKRVRTSRAQKLSIAATLMLG